MISAHEQSTGNGFSIGWITLALPQSLNALTLDMAVAALACLQDWATRPEISCVVLQGEGRGFCAGGDVRRMRDGILAGDDYCERFFASEYRLDHAIHHYPKPLLVWGHGVVMGGGVGLLVGASHRVVTPATRMAMPETAIGLYPDVGASVFLNRLPPGLGLFLGITGCEWSGADAVALGMADYLLDDKLHTALPDRLANAAWCGRPDEDRLLLDNLLCSFPSAAQPPQLTRYSNCLASACQDSLAEAVARLPALPIDEPWFTRALANLQHGCPVTACLVEQQLLRGRQLSLADAFRMEWTMSVQCCRHPDFPEGVRAQLVDKDKNPRWRFPAISAVPKAYIEQHFVQPVTEHPLADLA